MAAKSKTGLLIVDGQQVDAVVLPTGDVAHASFPGLPADLPPARPAAELDAETGRLHREPRKPKRGRKARQARLWHERKEATEDRQPTGDWTDDHDLTRRITRIVGSQDSRVGQKAEILADLFAEASALLGRALTGDEKAELEALVFGGEASPHDILRTLGTDSPDRRSPVPASVIVRVLEAWRDGLGDRDVRRLKYRRKPIGGMSTALVLKYGPEHPLLDENGKPVEGTDGRPVLVRSPLSDEQGKPILWVADEHGQPSRPYVRGEAVPPRPVSIRRPPVKHLKFR